jgi:hypothetical protein
MAAGQAEFHLDERLRRERGHRADRQSAAAHVERVRDRDRPSGPAGDRDAERGTRARATIEVVGEQMRRKRGQDLRRRGVLVDVAGDAGLGERRHDRRRGQRSGKHGDRHRRATQAAQPPHEGDRVGREAEVQDRQADRRRGAGERGARGGLAVGQHERLARVDQRRGEPIAHGRVLMGDENGLDSRHRYNRNRL